jgi:hypothetical protein
LERAEAAEGQLERAFSSHGRAVQVELVFASTHLKTSIVLGL